MTQTQDQQPTRAETQSIRSFMKRNALWFIILGFALLVTLISVFLNGTFSSMERLAADNSNRSGGQAVFEVLGQQGINTQSSNTLEQTLQLLAEHGPQNTTVLLYDDGQLLEDDQLSDLNAAVEHLILVQPNYQALNVLVPEILQAGSAGGDPKTAQCELPAAVNSGTISGGGFSYRSHHPDAVSCFPVEDDNSYALIQLADGSKTITVLGASHALENQFVTEEGNAALALNLLGESQTLIWYLPGPNDLHSEVPTLADLVPRWLTPLIILSLIVAIAAALWQGRRQGRLVYENLPVTVPASETLEGRARLYQKAQAINHSLDYLRMGSLKRIAAALGLSKSTPVEEIIVQISALTGWNQAPLYQLYLRERIYTEADLIRLSDQLALNETEIIRRTRW